MRFSVSDDCRGCGLCVRDCAFGVLTMKDGRPAVRDGREGQCMDCQHCLVVCPVGAVTINGVSAADCEPIHPVTEATRTEVAGLLKSRRSVRQFAQEAIPHEKIVELLETLKFVPTGCAVHHLDFRVIEGRARIEPLRQRMMETLAAHEDALCPQLRGIVEGWKKHPENDVVFRGAPNVLIVQGDPKAVTPWADCVACCAYFDLLAQASGYGVTWIGFLSMIIAAVPEVADVFGIPRGAPFHAMIFGAPAVRYARCVNRSSAAAIEWFGESL